VRVGQPHGGIRRHEQRRGGPGRRPGHAPLIVRVVDPRQRPPWVDTGVDPDQLPMGAGRAIARVEGDQGKRGGQSEREREVLVGLLLPSGAPRQLEFAGQLTQVSARGGRKKMRDPIYELESALRRPRGVESEQRNDAVDIDQEQGFVRMRIRTQSLRAIGRVAVVASPARRYGVLPAADSRRVAVLPSTSVRQPTSSPASVPDIT
jgi:hypothetical protein